MPLQAPEIHAFTGEAAGQLNELAVTVLNLVNYANSLEKRLDECKGCAGECAAKAAPAKRGVKAE